MDSILGIAVGLWIVGGLVILALGLWGKKIGISAKKTRTWLIAIGAVVSVVAVAAYFGAGSWLTAAPPSQTENPMFDVGVAVQAGSAGHVTYDSVAKTVTIAVTYNITTPAFKVQSQYCELNFTVSRADSLNVDSGSTVAVGAVSSVSITGAAAAYIVAKNTDSTFKVKWTVHGVSAWEHMSIPVVAFGSNYAICNITLNAVPFQTGGMSLYQSASFDLDVAGHVFVVNALYATQQH